MFDNYCHTRDRPAALFNNCTGDFRLDRNDQLDIALASDADGLHLGQDDLPVKDARRFLPIDKIIGCSITSAVQAATAESDGADYVAVGAIYPTLSKEAVEVIGLQGLRKIRGVVNLPLVALGGISKENIAKVISAGVDAVAVISAVLVAKDIAAACRDIVKVLEIDA